VIQVRSAVFGSSCLWAVVCLVLITGCSGGGEFSTAKVRGTVTSQGQPVAGAVVSFTPQAAAGGSGGKGATGITDADGRFVLTTYVAGDGAVVGKHYVAVSSEDANQPLPGKSPPELVLEVQSGSNDFLIELIPN
jgi:hypothetical protein